MTLLLWLVWYCNIGIASTEAIDAQVVSLEMVLQHIHTHPNWIIGQNTIEAAEASVMQAQAPFTPTISGQISEYNNKYPRQIQEHKVNLYTPIGAELSTSFERGTGDFPTYDDRETLSTGEIHFQLLLPLLDGLLVNYAQTDLANAKIDVDIEKYKQKQQQLDLLYKATAQYWKWYIAYQLEDLAKQNMDLAQHRQDILEKKYALGTISQLYVLDNKRELQERTQQWLEAQQYRKQEEIQLEYYYRDTTGNMINLRTTRHIPHILDSIIHISIPKKTDAFLQNRPDIVILDMVLEQITNQQRLNNAQKLPKLNLVLESYVPIDEVDKANEQYFGIKYEHSPLLRKEKGKEMELDAKIENIEQYRIKNIDMASQDIDGILSNLEQLLLQIQEQQRTIQLAEEVMRLEHIRFTKGDSEILDLIKRENNVVKAKMTLLKLEKQFLLEHAKWNQVNGFLE